MSGCNSFVVVLTTLAVTEERQKREELEKELKKLADLARQLIKHYDNCFVGLARQVRESPGNQSTCDVITCTVVPRSWCVVCILL